MPASVIVPAHDEEQVLPRLLHGLAPAVATGAVQLVVVANGCSDGTAEAAREALPDATVIETPLPSKHRALRVGDKHAHGWPRLYVDADVDLDVDSLHRLVRALAEPGVLAAAPRRVVDLSGASRGVRWYYEVWQRLPAVRHGLFGRGVVAVGPEGHARLQSLPELIADDLAAAIAFDPTEVRLVDEAVVVVHGPRRWGDLVARRVRAVNGTEQLQQMRQGGERLPTRTTRADLVTIARTEPRMALRIPVFLLVTLLARRHARRLRHAGDLTTWQRDESSRSSTAVSTGTTGGAPRG